MPIETLKTGILYGMKENLNIQFVYPDYELPQEYKDVIETIDHTDIKPASAQCGNSRCCHSESVEESVLDVSALDSSTSRCSAQNDKSKECGSDISQTEVVVFNGWEEVAGHSFRKGVAYVLRTSKAEMFANYKNIANILESVGRLNVVLTDVETLTDADFDTYKAVLAELSEVLEKLYVEGKTPQLNLLTDRMMLTEMNNCGAGDTNLTIAPDGKFYVCPAFYLFENGYAVGSLDEGVDVKNPQLYKLPHAPLCRNCDAYQCKRCIWLNRKTTLEINTPSHEQCVMAHLERNASRSLLLNIRKHGMFLPDKPEIKEIDYLDPFDVRKEW